MAAKMEAIADLFRPPCSPEPGTAARALRLPTFFANCQTLQPSTALRRLMIPMSRLLSRSSLPTPLSVSARSEEPGDPGEPLRLLAVRGGLVNRPMMPLLGGVRLPGRASPSCARRLRCPGDARSRSGVRDHLGRVLVTIRPLCVRGAPALVGFPEVPAREGADSAGLMVPSTVDGGSVQRRRRRRCPV